MTATPRQEPADLNAPALRARAVTAARGDAPFYRLITVGRLRDAVIGLGRKVDIGFVGALVVGVR
ncbi:adenine deaminase, partial [Rhizobium ruizarguesonis]